jgi:hypothetical protein
MKRLGALPLGIVCDPRYRTVAEADIVELLLFHGWAVEIAAGGDRSAARDEADAALEGLIRDGLSFERDPGGGRRFDPAEVHNFAKFAGLHRGSTLWEERFVATARRLFGVDPGHRSGDGAGAQPPDLDRLPDRRFSVTLQRDFALAHIRAGARTRLRLPLPIPDEALRDLTVEVVPPAGLDAEIVAGPGRLDATFAMPDTEQVSFGVRLSFTAAGVRPTAADDPLDPEMRALYLRPRETLLVVSPRIRALAAELTEGVLDPETMLRRFWDFMLDRLTAGVIHYDELPADRPTDWALEGGWSDCQLGCALLAALCRSCGIPARLSSGYVLWPAAPTYHYWLEVWLAGRGWVPLDVAAWHLSVGGRDAAWRGFLFGCLDYRMKTQAMPRLFTGTPSIRFPAAWHQVPRMEARGTSTVYIGVEGGDMLYRDRHVVDMGETVMAPARPA